MFKQAKLLVSLQTICPELLAISARYIHLFDVAESLSVSDQHTLSLLLEYGEPYEEEEASDETSHFECLVVPRLGTISPWSSKATDILQNCGLTQVRRVERGSLFRLCFAGTVEETVASALQSQLHDRMTQTVLPGVEHAAAMFVSSEPQPLKSVDLLGQERRHCAGPTLSGDWLWLKMRWIIWRRASQSSTGIRMTLN